MSARNGGDAEPGHKYGSLLLPMRLHSLQRRTFSSVCLRPASKGSRRVPRLLRTKKWNVCNRRHCGSGKEVQPQLSAPQTSPQRLDSRDSTRAPDQKLKGCATARRWLQNAPFRDSPRTGLLSFPSLAGVSLC